MIQVTVLDRFPILETPQDTAPKEGCVAILLDQETGTIALIETIDGLPSHRIDLNAIALGELRGWLNDHFAE